MVVFGLTVALYRPQKLQSGCDICHQFLLGFHKQNLQDFRHSALSLVTARTGDLAYGHAQLLSLHNRIPSNEENLPIADMAYASSQARGLIGAVADSLHQSHSNMGSKPCLQPTP